MYYHVILDLDDKFYKRRPEQVEIKSDLIDLNEIKAKYIESYEIGNPILMNGRTIPVDHIKRLRIFQSEISAQTLKQQESARREAEDRNSDVLVVGFYFNDLKSAILKQKEITDDLVKYAKGTKKQVIQQINENAKVTPTKVFIVHGRDDALIHEVQNFLYKLSLEGIVLNQHLNQGRTIIQKLLDLALDPQVGFGIVLYTPDDLGQISRELEQNSEMTARARQNVIFEHGLLVGKLGMSKVIALKKSDQFLEMPNDLSGVIYEQYDSSGSWQYRIAKEIKAQGYNIDLNNI